MLQAWRVDGQMETLLFEGSVEHFVELCDEKGLVSVPLEESQEIN